MEQPNSTGRLYALTDTSTLILGPQTTLLPGCLFRLYMNEVGEPMNALLTGVIADIVDHGKGIRLLIVVAAEETQPKCRELFLQQLNLLEYVMVQELLDLRGQPASPLEKQQRVLYTEDWCEGASEAYDGAIYIRINELTTVADIDLSIPDMQGFLPFEEEIQEPPSTRFAPGTHILCKRFQLLEILG
ncbi:hypothetical protein B0H11DRAFT_2256359 [Mycena galericulata]|nr:hypothetical protein B0H11DRAFT_2256359 [Mycena galericulata]